MDDIINATGRKQNKAITLNFDDLSYEPNNTCLYCLADNEVRLLLALLEYVGWKTRWYSPTGATIDQQTIDRLKAGIMYELMADNCDISAGLTALQTCCAELSYRFTLMEQNMCVAQEMALNFYRQNLINAGQPAYPDTTYSSDTSLVDQTGLYAGANGLCQTIYRYINSVLADQLTRDALAVGLIAGGASVINPILGIISAGIGSVLLADFAIAVSDQSAIDDVACCMYKNLRDAEVTPTTFAHALDDCGFSFPDNNATIAGAIALTLGDEGDYLSFVATLRNETNKSLATSPTTYPVCGSCGCSDVIDFTAGEMGDWELVVGVHDGANGIKSVDNTDNPYSSHHAVIRLRRKFGAPCDITNVKIEYKWTSDSEGRPTTGENGTIYWHIETAGCTSPWNTTSGATAIGGGTGGGPGTVQTAGPQFIGINDVNCIEIHDVTAVYKWYIRKIWINP